MSKKYSRRLAFVIGSGLLLAAFFFVLFGMRMGFPAIASTLCSGAGAIIGLAAGTLLVKFFSLRIQMWGLRLLGGLSLLPLIENVDYVRSSAIAELGNDPKVATFVIVSFIVIFTAIGAGWILCSLFPPLIAAVPPSALIAYEKLALRNVLWQEGFWPDNVSLVWLFIFEAGATVFLLAAGWLVWRARNSARLTGVPLRSR